MTKMTEGKSKGGAKMAAASSRRFGIITSALMALAPVCGVAAASEAPFEQPPALATSEVLPPELLAGEHFKVADEVVNDGYMNTYRLVSDFGEFDAYGVSMLAVRVHEVGALAELDQLSKTKVFADAVASGALGPVNTIVEFSKRPVATVKRIPSGIKRMFFRYRRQAEEGYEEAKDFVAGEGEEEAVEAGEESEAAAEEAEAAEPVEKESKSSKLTKRYLGVTSAQREWARKLGVDPYTSNEVLTKALERVAWVERTAKIGFRFVPMPGIEGVDYISDANELAWSKDPYELKDLNEKRLRDAGADDELIEAFFEMEGFTPTLQTRLIGLLAGLEGAEGRVHLIERAMTVESEASARFLIQSVAMMEWFHRNESKVVRVIPGRGLPFAVVEDGRTVGFAAVDYLCWTEEVASLAAERIAETTAGATERRELWLLGAASSRCREELDARGWQVRDELGTVMKHHLLPAVEEPPRSAGREARPVDEG
jgi:hypothetical protein